MRLSEVVDTSRQVSETNARLEKIDRIATLLRRLQAHEVPLAVAYLSGDLPQGRIGIGPAKVRDAFPESAAIDPVLEVAEVEETFSRIASASGSGSATERAHLLRELLSRATRAEQEFISKLVMGELRQGALQGVMVEAVAKATDVPASAVRRALMFAGNLSEVAHTARLNGAEGLSSFSIELFRPVQPMLAQPANELADALLRMKTAALEYKLDGARVQIHRVGDDVRVYTRRLNDVTSAVPELVERVRALPAREIVLDGEALSFRPDGRPHPFQVTMRRFGRKQDVARMREELPITTSFFDCLYLEGEDLVDRPTLERFAAMEAVLPADLVITRRLTGNQQDAEDFLKAALAAGHEGIMAKALDAPYAAGRRGQAWLKLKPTHTLDLVVLAAEWGSGRRRGWLSNLHLGARDPVSGGFVMLGKTFKGLDDQTLAWQTKRLQELEVATDAYTVYVRPELVAEIAFDGVQESPRYPAGLTLRFARLMRYRPDKRAADADTIDAVRKLHLGIG